MGTGQRDDVNADRNVHRVCLASRGPVRESVRRINERWRQSGRTAFLPDFPLLFQPSLNNQSLFAEIGIGSAWNAAEASVPEKISEFCKEGGCFWRDKSQFVFTSWSFFMCGEEMNEPESQQKRFSP